MNKLRDRAVDIYIRVKTVSIAVTGKSWKVWVAEIQIAFYIRDRAGDLISHATPGQFEYRGTRGFHRPRNAVYVPMEIEYGVSLGPGWRRIRQLEKFASENSRRSRETVGPITVGDHLNDGSTSQTAGETSFLAPNRGKSNKTETRRRERKRETRHEAKPSPSAAN